MKLMSLHRIFQLMFLLCGLGWLTAAQASPANDATPAGVPLQAKFTTLNIKVDMLRIPQGCFYMGSPEDETDRDSDEGPQQKVCLESFSLGKYEVTQGLWRQVMGDNPASFNVDDRHPVEMVSWNDVQLFLQRLNDATGRHYRLPSEAEWEYAARAGTDKPFWWEANSKKSLFGSQKSISHDNANFGKEECCSGYATDKDLWKYTAPVGSFAASPWGTHDMRGNVWEWVQDCYKESYDNVSTNGKAWTAGGCEHRVFRGGSWDNGPDILRAANRSWDDPAYRFRGLGLRLAETVEPLHAQAADEKFERREVRSRENEY